MICILLATYNGETYLKEQLDSLLYQTESDFHLYISDDCSTDGTFSIVQEYASRYPEKIFAAQNTRNSGSCGENFLQLLYRCRSCGYDYFLFSDQDDVWMPDKILRTMAVMKDAEASYGVKTPLLAFTDLRLVDASLHTIEPSIWASTGVGQEPITLQHGVLKCPCHGCTALFNRALAECMRTPVGMEVHDWWLYLTAVLFGKACRLPEPTILYRQHGGNTLGSQRTLSLDFVLKRMLETSDIRKNLRFTYRQAGQLLDIYGSDLEPAQRSFLADYAKIPSYGKLKRIRELYRLHALKNGLPARIAQLLFC